MSLYYSKKFIENFYLHIFTLVKILMELCFGKLLKINIKKNLKFLYYIFGWQIFVYYDNKYNEKIFTFNYLK